MALTSRNRLIVNLIISLILSFGSLGATLLAGWGPKLGLDLAGGLSVVYKPTKNVPLNKMNEAVTILSNRVNGLGVSGAQVNLQGRNIVVSVPGVTDARSVLNSVGQTAQLLMRPVLCYANAPTKPLASVTAVPACSSANLLSAANLGVTPTTSNAAGYTMNNVGVDTKFNNIPSTTPANDDPRSTVILPVLGQKTRLVLGPAQLDGTAIARAQAQIDTTGAWSVNYTLTKKGSPLWDQVAQSNFHQMVAIELDGVVQSAPLIYPAQSTFTSFGGSGQISGSFTSTSAKSLALALNYGALPVRLKALTTQTVSPTLGHSALVAGLGAGIVGLLLVLLYTILYYRMLGFVIVLGLGATSALLWAIISLLAHTALAPSFDLAGVTGLIVSIGITVDSYIVYFERLKDEARSGRSLRTSVDRGFKSAWRTVLAADFVSLLAAVLLYLIAVGSVRGFAFFLGLSTLLDIAMTWYFTRPLVVLLGRRQKSSQSALSMAAGLQSEVGNE
jgi:preprotein translocase subunit SecD